jgi:hypothetical protein
MANKVILYHSSHCPPCINFIQSGKWKKVQEMCNNENLGVEFEEYDRVNSEYEKLFKLNYIEATPTFVILRGGEEERTHVQDPKKLFDMIKSGHVVQHGGGPTKSDGPNNDPYYQKYLKYKAKYMQIKNNKIQ